MTDTVEWVGGRITDEGVQAAIDRIGVPRPIRSSVITEESVQRFAFGVGDDNPLWWDRGYAEATRWGAMFGPPTSILGGARSRPGDNAEPGGLVECELLARNQRDEVSTTAVATVRLPHRPGEYRTDEHYPSENRVGGSPMREQAP